MQCLAPSELSLIIVFVVDIELAYRKNNLSSFRLSSRTTLLDSFTMGKFNSILSLFFPCNYRVISCIVICEYLID